MNKEGSALSGRQSVVLIGSGAVATSLGHALRDAGYSIVAIISASINTARKLSLTLGGATTSSRFEDLPTSDLVFVCVPDSAITRVAHRLAAVSDDWSGRLVAHTSGALHAAALEPVEASGATILSFHPLQSFPSNGGSLSAIKSFQDIFVGLEGSEDAVEEGRTIADAIGAKGIRVPTPLKETYHLAASVASNLVVAVVAMANEILESSGLNAEAGPEMFLPLIQGTLDNLKRTSPERALTGPIVRGDSATVRKHVEALTDSAPHLRPAYLSLASEAVRAAVRGGHISVPVAEDLLDVLLHGLDIRPE